MFRILYGWDNKDTFLHSLSFWQVINLHAVLLLGQNSSMTPREARAEAIRKFDPERKGLKFLLEQALNSPDPKI